MQCGVGTRLCGGDVLRGGVARDLALVLHRRWWLDVG